MMRRGREGKVSTTIDHESAVLREHLDTLRTSYDRAIGALRSVHAGVVVCDRDGVVVLRNETGGTDLLVEQAIKEALVSALNGHNMSRNLELFGPPRRYLDVSASPILRHDELLGAVAVVDDVSERRRTEQVRRDFVSNISHELRTPVGALCVLAETMAAETDPLVLQRLATRMEVESTRLAHMIDDLLTLTMIEADEAGEPDPVSPWSVVSEAVARILPAAERRGIRVMVNDSTATVTGAGEAARILVLGDRRQLTSAIFNLLDNALKYSDRGSVVSVDIKRVDDGQVADVHDDHDRDLARVRIDVTDQGIGIPPRDRERIFERFYRVDKARARDTGGTGLGLSIVRHVVHNHGGEVTVVSREGEGSTFSITLPILAPSAPSQAPSPAQSPAPALPRRS
jgi:two-component system, OmpR family, sensor histidine kinase SenX3